MSSLKDLVNDRPVHERRVEIRTYAVEDEQLVVEGWLRDERLIDGFHWDGRARPPGAVHWMCVRLLVQGWPLTIKDAEAEMPTAPHELCPTVMEKVKNVIGVPIVSGFSEEVRRRLGGIEGCAHMAHLIVSMGPAALHGYWTHRSRKLRPLPRTLKEFPGLEYVINSCELWREEGPMVQAIRERIEKQAERSNG